MDLWLVGSGGETNLHRCGRRSLALHLSSSAMSVVWAEAAVHDALEGCVLALEVGAVLQQALKEELLAPGARIRLHSRRLLCWAWDLCRPRRRREEGLLPHVAEGGGGGAKPGTVGMCTRGMALAAVPSSSPYASLPPTLFLSLCSPLHSSLLAETAPQSFRYDALGGDGGCINVNGIFYGSDGA